MQIRLFGEVAIEGPDGGVSAGPPAQKKVLSLMALRAGYRCSLDRLIDQMWGDEPPENSDRMIRMYVSGIRKLLAGMKPEMGADGLVVTEDGGYRLAIDELDVDVLRFDRLVTEAEATMDARVASEAMSLWRGDPLAEFAYDDFAIRVRERLERRRLDALELRFSSDLRLGVTTGTIDELHELVEEHPWREGLWELLITGLYRAGRQADALRAFDRCSQRLGEIGLEPGPDLRRIAAAVARHDTSSLALLDPEGRLPADLDRFVGRTGELRQIAGLLADGRLVSLVGAGGCGKTRLAIEAARQARWPAWFIDLSDVSVSGGIAEEILSSLGRSQRSTGDPLSPAVTAIGPREMLMVLDNCEHLLDAVGPAVERLLTECPNLVILATSREPLGVRGEAVLTVPPLPLPSGGHEEIFESDAGRLFVERVAAATGDFELSDENAPAVDAILRRLDGIPLAIELVAPLVRTRGIDEVGRLLRESVADVGSPRRTALARHRTMTAALDWSYQLLGPEERTAFRSLGAMRAEFDDAAAAAVAGSYEVVHALIAKSLVERTGDGINRLLVPIREFARRLASDAGEMAEFEERRNRHFVEIGRELAGGFRRGDEEDWQIRFEAVRVHLALALEDLTRHEPDEAAGLMRTLSRYWVNLGLYAEGVRLSSALMDDRVDLATRLDIQVGMAHMMQRGGDVPRAEQLALSALAQAREAELGPIIGLALNALGSNQAEAGDMATATGTLQEAVEVYSAHRPTEWFVPHVNLGAVSAWSGRVPEASRIRNTLRTGVDTGDIPSALQPFVDLLDGAVSRFAMQDERADRVLSRSVVGFGRTRSEFHRQLAFTELALVQLARGELAAAEESIDRVLDESAEASSLNRLRAGDVHARVALARGDPNAARTILRELLSDPDLVDLPGRVAEAADTVARLAAEAGESDVVDRLVPLVDRLRDGLRIARDPREEAEVRALVDGKSIPPEPTEDLPGTIMRIARDHLGLD